MYKILAISFLLINNFVLAQEYITIDTVKYKCIYNYEFQQDSLSKYSIKSQEMALLIGNRYSKFLSTTQLYKDSIAYKYKDETVSKVTFNKILPLIQGSFTHAYCKYYVFKDFPENGITLLNNYINKKNYKVSEKIHFNWDIEHDSDTTILGFICNKATTTFAGRDYIAWYTIEVPKNEGPYKFRGLPGLIIKIRDKQNQHRFELTSINELKCIKPILFKKNNFISVSPKEYVKILDYRMRELFNKIQSEDGIILKSDESKAKALNNVKSRNNFIERY